MDTEADPSCSHKGARGTGAANKPSGQLWPATTASQGGGCTVQMHEMDHNGATEEKILEMVVSECAAKNHIQEGGGLHSA